MDAFYSSSIGLLKSDLEVASPQPLPLRLPETYSRRRLPEQCVTSNTIYEQKQAALAALKKSLLHQALAGEL